ncbi:hypothetical protein BH24ACT24_BH24ACT24_00350 [soil metagenome]
MAHIRTFFAGNVTPRGASPDPKSMATYSSVAPRSDGL